MADEDVPWRTALRIAALVESTHVVVELVKDGDHRLSRDRDLARRCAAIDTIRPRRPGFESFKSW